MPYQNLSVNLTDAQRDAILAKISELEALVPFLIDLTDAEKVTLPKMADGTLAFVEKTVEYEQSTPDLVPPFVDPAEHAKDLILAKQLRPIERRIAGLAEKLSDTLTAAGSEAYVASLTFYASAKAAAKVGVPGAQTIVEDLAKRFAGQGKAKPTPQP